MTIDLGRLSQLTLRQLRYFVAVAEARNFRRAAEKLRMSQPPLTQAMKALEATLGVRLFEREGRGIRLTPAADELLAGTEQLFRMLVRLRQRVRSANEAGGPRLAVGLTDDFVHSPLLLRLMTFEPQAMPATFATIVEFSPMLLRQLLDGVIDIALTLESPGGYPKGIAAIRLPASRIMALVPVGHPLAAAKQVSPVQLVRERLVMMPEDWPSPFARQCTRIFEAAGVVVPKIAYHAASATIDQNIVEQGLAVGLVSEFSVRDTAASVRIPLKSRHATLAHALLYDSERKSKLIPQLVDLLTEDMEK